MTITKCLSTILHLVIVATMFVSCGSSNSQEPQETETIQTEIQPIYDVPSLIGKNIDEIRTILGKPSDNEIEPSKLQMKMGFDSWENSFEKDGRTLLVTFNPQNREVVDFFIETNDPSGSTSDYSNLLQICNLTNGESNYSIEPVPTIKDNSQYTGIRIVAK